MNLSDRITILIPTHFIRTAPSAKLVEHIISVMDFEELVGCKCMINYDIPSDKSKQQLQYEENLRNIDTKFDLEVYSTVGGQRKSFLNIIDKVTTDYFLFIEHDWVFKKRIDFKKLIALMDREQDVHYILFNKRKNVQSHGDWVLEEADYRDVPLLKTPRWSNNPYIARTSKWINDWRPYVIADQERLGKPHGQVEHLMYIYWSEIERDGFESAHKRWGTFLYGNMGDPPVVKHLDGNFFGLPLGELRKVLTLVHHKLR